MIHFYMTGQCPELTEDENKAAKKRRLEYFLERLQVIQRLPDSHADPLFAKLCRTYPPETNPELYREGKLTIDLKTETYQASEVCTGV